MRTPSYLGGPFNGGPVESPGFASPIIPGVPGTDPFGLGASELRLDAPKTYHIPSWDWMDDRKRVALLRRIAEQSGRDPRIRTLAAQIVQAAGAGPRNYPAQAAALLAFVQNKIYYVNEPGEILQDPLYTLKVGHGDCDDMALILCALAEALRLPWKYVLSGVDKSGRKIRWIEGERYPASPSWSHIYCALGWPPFQPQEWAIAEPTVRGVQLGHDVAMTGSVMPEMSGSSGRLAGLGRSPFAGLGAWEEVERAVSVSGAVVGAGVGALLGYAAAKRKGALVGAVLGASAGLAGTAALNRDKPYVVTAPPPPQSSTGFSMKWSDIARGGIQNVLAPALQKQYGSPISVLSPSTAASRGVAAGILAELEWKNIASATIVGVGTSVIGQIVIDAVRAWMKIKGH